MVDVVSKNGQGSGTAGSVRSASGVTTAEVSGVHANAGGSGIGANSGAPENAEGCGDTSSSPPPPQPSVPDDIPVDVDWAKNFIMPDEEGDHNAAVDEDILYEAMGFKAADERAEEATRQAVPIPTMTAEMQSDMAEAAIPVHDNVEEEPLFDWDRDNPDMSVGTCYPSMQDFRLAVKHHAIVNEFELATAHSDKQRFRGNCGSLGCPRIIRAKRDGSVRVFFLCDAHIYFSCLQYFS